MSQDDSQRQIDLIRLLGKGGFGLVYLADLRSQNNFKQRIAVKVLNPDVPHMDDLVARQRDEARLLAQLNHDHIVKVIDLVEIGDRPAILMEYIEGASALELIQCGPIPPRAVMEIAAAVSSALDAAHNQLSPYTGRPLRVIHRDIKPSNILITPNGGVKVLDFGVARADVEREAMTRAHALGSLRYMAPEQWANDPLTAAIDIFALGYSMTELLSGQRQERMPLTQKNFEKRQAEMVAALTDASWPQQEAQQLCGLVSRMLSFEAEDRPLPGEVHEVCLDLMDAVPGQRLRKYARQHIRGLLEARLSTFEAEPGSVGTATFALEDLPDDAPLKASITAKPGQPAADRGDEPTLAPIPLPVQPPSKDPVPAEPTSSGGSANVPLGAVALVLLLVGVILVLVVALQSS